MVEVATERMKTYIEDGLVELHFASAANLPFESKKFDKIFHTNVFYFWEDQIKVCSELLRVLKNGGLMLSALDLKKVAASASMGLLDQHTSDVKNYMLSLQAAGFENVRMAKYEKDHITFGCIYAYKSKV